MYLTLLINIADYFNISIRYRLHSCRSVGSLAATAQLKLTLQIWWWSYLPFLLRCTHFTNDIALFVLPSKQNVMHAGRQLIKYLVTASKPFLACLQHHPGSKYAKCITFCLFATLLWHLQTKHRPLQLFRLNPLTLSIMSHVLQRVTCPQLCSLSCGYQKSIISVYVTRICPEKLRSYFIKENDVL